jgi:hypothetical protein
VEYDKERSGFAGSGEYIHPEKHASFDFFMALADKNSWDSGDISAAAEPQPTQVAAVSDQTITVSMAYDSGEGIYTGAVKGGVPHDQGSFEMLSSNNGNSWRYEGRW